MDESCFGFGQSGIIITLNYTIPGGEAPDSVVLFRVSGQRIQQITQGLPPGQGLAFFPNFTASTWQYNEPIHAVVCKNGYSGQTPSLLIPICVDLKPEMFQENEIQLFPNPSNQFISLKSDSKILYVGIQIYDYTGRKVLEIENHSLDKSIEISTIKKGLYFVKIKIQPFKILVKRLVKNF